MSRTQVALIPAALVLLLLSGCVVPQPPDRVRISRMDFLNPLGPPGRPPVLSLSRTRFLANDALIVSVTPGRHVGNQRTDIAVRGEWTEIVRTSETDPGTRVKKWRTWRTRLPDLKDGRVRLHVDLRDARAGDYEVSAEVFDVDNQPVTGRTSARFAVEADPWAPEGGLPTIRYRGRDRKYAGVVAEDGIGPPMVERTSPWTESLPIRLRGEPGATLSAEVRLESWQPIRGLRTRLLPPRTLPGLSAILRVKENHRLVDYPVLNLLSGTTVRYVLLLTVPGDATPGLHEATFRLEADAPRLCVDVPVLVLVPSK